jgi:hypothetical protein
MNYRMLIVAVALIAVRLVVPFASAEPKAYDTVFYKGKAAGLKIVFEFGHGYVEASNVKITESASGKTTKFYLSGRDGQMGTDKMRFAPVKGAKKEVLLEMDPFGDPLPTVKGSYTAAGKTVPFTLTKRKKHLKGSTADLSSKNAVSFSSARTTKRFPSSRCASTIQIVRPLESIAETQPQLHPALLRLSAIISQNFTLKRIVLPFPCPQQYKMIKTAQ